MFHRFITHNDKKIDYDRAAWLMDREVFAEARAALPSALGQTDFDHAMAKKMTTQPTTLTKDQILQVLWDNYCIKHEIKYGVPFDPDVM